MAHKAAPYEGLRVAARQSLVKGMDETGWRRDGWPGCGTCVSEQVTVYRVLPGRGFPEAALLLGADYAGWLVHDGLRCYYGFQKAFHHICLAHLVRRGRDIGQVVGGQAAGLPLRVRGLLQQALALGDRYEQYQSSLHGQ
jgi:transposase